VSVFVLLEMLAEKGTSLISQSLMP